MKGLVPTADVCLILEGTYPFVPGGVSNWTHELIRAQRHLSFHLLTLVPPEADLTPIYDVPNNVVGTSVVRLQRLPEGSFSNRKAQELLTQFEKPLLKLQSKGDLTDFIDLLSLIEPHKEKLGRGPLLNSRAAWDLLHRMYEATLPQSPFLHYFWSWRTMHGSLYSVLLAELPAARTYHAVSTGYAGLLGARAHLETGRPMLLTEHGIYTNERRVELSMADWLFDHRSSRLSVDKPRHDLKSMWIDTFQSYSRACYAASSTIITLYEGNTEFQLQDGAPREKITIIPNGIDHEHYSKIERTKTAHPPTVALIGRVVPIKDVKMFIRTCAILKRIFPDLQAKILGPTDEDQRYFRDCHAMANGLSLLDTISFVGRVNLTEHIASIDVVLLTSISEAQPLVILEVGAAGVPVVATDVGACRELILGNSRDTQSEGAGGAVTPLGDPTAMAHEVERLLKDREWYEQCSRTIKARVLNNYDKHDLDERYRYIYESACSAPDSPSALERND